MAILYDYDTVIRCSVVTVIKLNRYLGKGG
jgi:hypothetical protein